ncbi:MAG: hydroxymethylglutaryl-CoA lyase [Candidatus Schekmanbacteria bacterium]|nr:hydroxymethylglutaryl-CoA lyase [Candidatus Schekmanbacteria bacterium]
MKNDGAVRIVEVGPRDGLQNESVTIPTEVKVAFVEALAKCGAAEIEVGAFVSPRRIPQLADSDEVFLRIRREPGILYSALVPNSVGLERALEVGVDKVSIFTAASETFNLKNINVTIAGSMKRFQPVVDDARAAGLPVRGYVSTAFHCPYEGRVAPDAVVTVVEQLLELGVDEISLGDTIGKASPEDVKHCLDAVLKVAPVAKIALHFHDTYGMAVANSIAAALGYDIATFDAAAGGLGGCPYAPGATGNVATEDLVYAFKSMGIPTGVNLDGIVSAVSRIVDYLGRPIASHLGRVFLTRGAVGSR